MAGDAPRTEKAERRQVAALPWRRGDTGIEILLVTSRETRRWVLKRRAPRWCVVALYGLEVTAVHRAWEEQAERERVWLSRDEAADRVDEPDLKALIAGFEP